MWMTEPFQVLNFVFVQYKEEGTSVLFKMFRRFTQLKLLTSYISLKKLENLSFFKVMFNAVNIVNFKIPHYSI